MDIHALLQAGTQVQIERLHSDCVGSYVGTIDSLEDDNHIFIVSLPNGTDFPIAAGDEINININTQEEMYIFQAMVLDRDGYYLEIIYPEDAAQLQRRSYWRVPVSMEVQYRLKDHPDRTYYPGEALDLSGGGMRLQIQHSFKVGDRVEMKFKLPNGPICDHILGVVGWVRTTGDENTSTLRYACGVKFEGITENLRMVIIACVLTLKGTEFARGMVHEPLETKRPMRTAPTVEVATTPEDMHEKQLSQAEIDALLAAFQNG